MTHDFARQRAERAQRSGKPASPSWLWFVTGVVTGILGSFLVYLATLAPRPHLAERGDPSQEKPAASVAAATRVEKPQFDFYTILPESEVIVGDRPADTAAPAAEKKPAAEDPARESPAAEASKTVPPPAHKSEPVEVPEPIALVLQAGSFRQAAEAERRRANIILLGFPARVETVNVRGGETWYRVQVGPFGSADALADARRTLDGQGISTVEIGKRA